MFIYREFASFVNFAPSILTKYHNRYKTKKHEQQLDGEKKVSVNI